MTRKQWKEAVEVTLPRICASRGFSLTWSGYVAKVAKNGAKVEIALQGLWFLGSENKLIAPLIKTLESPSSVLRSKPGNLGEITPYLQPSGRLAVDCTTPTSAAELEGVVDAIDVILVMVANTGLSPVVATTPKANKKKSVTFEQRCELAVVIAESIVRSGMEGRVSTKLSERVFGIAEFAPIVGESDKYRNEQNSRPDPTSRREHVVPCKEVTDFLLNPTFHQQPIKSRVEHLRRLLKIVLIADDERRMLDRHFRLKNQMPAGHSLQQGCIYARLTAAGISRIHLTKAAASTPACNCESAGCESLGIPN